MRIFQKSGDPGFPGPVVCALILLLVFTADGCARRVVSKTTQTVPGSTVTVPGSTATTTTVAEPTVVRETTVVEKERETGVLSGTIHVLGEIIALPFRLVAGLFRWIF